MNKLKEQRKRNKKALKEWKEQVNARWKKCAMCGSKRYLNAHHLLSYRLYKEYRYDIDNGLLLCSGCHRFKKSSAHQDPIVFSDWLLKNYPLIYNWVIRSSK